LATERECKRNRERERESERKRERENEIAHHTVIFFR
jgi:hypothetical protein